jgi:hemoglobin-like flavoprotein
MTEEQIALVKNSWKMFRNVDAAVVADVFYSKLFFENPKLRQLFPASMQHQYKKLIDMLSVIISRLDKFDEVTKDIKAMAVRHEQYGVKPHHYRLVGNALLWTLERGLGNYWNDELNAAWFACYTALAETMIDSIRKDSLNTNVSSDF